MCRNPGGALALWTGFPELPLLFLALALALTGGVSTLAFFAARASTSRMRPARTADVFYARASRSPTRSRF